MINMEFPIHTEAEDGTQHFLLKLRDSQLKDDAILEEFYDKVIAAYDYGENYYIILIHCALRYSARQRTVRRCLTRRTMYTNSYSVPSVLSEAFQGRIVLQQPYKYH